MDNLQNQVFDDTEKLLSKMNITKVLMNTFVSIIVIIAVLYFAKYQISVPFVIAVIAASFGFAYFRELSESKRTRKHLQKYFDYLRETKPKIELFIPLITKVKNLYYQKQSCLYIDKGVLYLEAFKTSFTTTSIKESICVKYGKDFEITSYEIDENLKTINMVATLGEGQSTFSIVNNETLINIIKQFKGEN